MAYGLPVVASEYAIAAREMILEGINGYLFRPEEIDDMVYKINSLLKDQVLCKNMGRSSYQIAKRYTIHLYF